MEYMLILLFTFPERVSFKFICGFEACTKLKTTIFDKKIKINNADVRFFISVNFLSDTKIQNLFRDFYLEVN
jgi:hypothetical protein